MNMINQERKPFNIDPELVIGSREAARILGVSEREVRSKIKRGTLPAVKYGRKYFLHRGAVEVYQGLRTVLNCDASADAVQSVNKSVVQNNLIPGNYVSSKFDLPGANDWPPVYPNALRKLWQL
jgi:excisionase family DNA binding protein